MSKWSWSLSRGLGWTLPVGIGALAGVRGMLATSIAFRGDYSPLLLVFGAAGLALWLGGFHRISDDQAKQEADIRDRIAKIQKPKNGQE